MEKLINHRKKLYLLTLGMGSGGAEKVISLLLPSLANDFNVTLVLFSHESHFKIPDNIEIIYLTSKNKLSFLNKVFLFPLSVIKYSQLLLSNNVDVSISFLTRPNLLNGFCKIWVPKTKVILSERCYPSIAYKSSKLRYFLYKLLIPLLYNKADSLFSNSIYINQDLSDNFNLKIPSYVVYNPVERIIGTLKNNDASSQVFKLINVGSIYAIKNQALILTALSNCSCNFKIDFVGDGVLKDSLNEQSANLGLTNYVKFVGRVKNVNEFLLNSDCFILSSNSEGFPNVLLEAMASGLPVISTNCFSGPLEILNENFEVVIEPGGFVLAKFGILINVNDQKGLTAAIDHLFNDLQLRYHYSRMSLERVKDYSITNIYEKLLKVINDDSR